MIAVHLVASQGFDARGTKRKRLLVLKTTETQI